jgi:hypothetical protein
MKIWQQVRADAVELNIVRILCAMFFQYTPLGLLIYREYFRRV